LLTNINEFTVEGVGIFMTLPDWIQGRISGNKVALSLSLIGNRIWIYFNRNKNKY